MGKVGFVAAAREEFLAEVEYYNKAQAGVPGLLEQLKKLLRLLWYSPILGHHLLQAPGAW